MEKIIKGIWKNEYGSIMEITNVQVGIFEGTYSSHTGDTGTYKVVGVYNDKNTDESKITVSFAISWQDVTNNSESSYSFATSGMSGQIQIDKGSWILPVIHILTTPNPPGDRWKNSLIDKLIFVKQS